MLEKISQSSAPALPFVVIPSRENKLKKQVFFLTQTGSPVTKITHRPLGRHTRKQPDKDRKFHRVLYFRRRKIEKQPSLKEQGLTLRRRQNGKRGEILAHGGTRKGQEKALVKGSKIP